MSRRSRLGEDTREQQRRSGGQHPAVPLHRAARQPDRGRWQDRWDGRAHLRDAQPVRSAGRADRLRCPADKLYVLDMFPYPSGAGLHVGHPLGYIGTDVLGRFPRMNGATSCTRWATTRSGCRPSSTRSAPAPIRGPPPRRTSSGTGRSCDELGFAHDPRRSVATTDVEFYRWTQWIFLQLFNAWYDADAQRARPIDGAGRRVRRRHPSGARRLPTWNELTASPSSSGCWPSHRLAYISEAPVNWCPGLGTVLSNEEVTADGTVRDRQLPGLPAQPAPVDDADHRLRRPADRRPGPAGLAGVGEGHAAQLDRPIGRRPGRRSRSLGADRRRDRGLHHPPGHPVRRHLHGAGARSTRWSASITASEWPAGTDPRWTGGADTPAEAVERVPADRPRARPIWTGRRPRRRPASSPVPTPATRSPATEIPVFIADYVLMGYGTGAIMAVPGQDTRDWDFATAFGLPIVRTVQPPARPPGGRGRSPATARRSTAPTTRSSLNGLDVAEAKAAMIEWLAAKGCGQPQVQYKLRDWLFSRQRYWGEPFPIVYSTEPGSRTSPIALPDSLLPLELPDVIDYAPAVLRPDGRRFHTGAAAGPGHRVGDRRRWTWATGRKTYRRELNVMPQWAGSCWYELRYLDPTQQRAFRRPGGREVLDGPQATSATASGTPAASTCTSAASSTRCCTCCTRGSGTRCCSTWATCPARSRSGGCSTRATSRPTPTPTSAGSTCRPRMSFVDADGKSSATRAGR